MPVSRPPTLPKVGISPQTHARVTLAAAELGETLYDFMERAATRELAAARHQVKVDRYHAALREADRSHRVIRPTPAEFGWRADFGLPATPAGSIRAR